MNNREKEKKFKLKVARILRKWWNLKKAECFVAPSSVNNFCKLKSDIIFYPEYSGEK